MALPFGTTHTENGLGGGTALRFPGQLWDAETGYHYNYFRDYDPSTGRYLQPDPIGLQGGLNRYGYVGANPVSLTDPEGLRADDCTLHKWKCRWPEWGAGGGGGRAASGSASQSNFWRNLWVLLGFLDKVADGPAVHVAPFGRSCPLTKPLPDTLQELLKQAVHNEKADDPEKGEGAHDEGTQAGAAAGKRDFWDSLKPSHGKTRTNAKSGKKKRYYEQDRTHGDLEVYDGRGHHLGSADPNTGEMTKPPVPGRRINVP